ncbi:putative membrane protein [Desulfosporosinus sp. OT]|nr:putative membrane protein [Desulfosporosinus sp. OT]
MIAVLIVIGLFALLMLVVGMRKEAESPYEGSDHGTNL